MSEVVNRFRDFTPILMDAKEGQQIDPTAVIEDGAIIGPHVHIGKDMSYSIRSDHQAI